MGMPPPLPGLTADKHLEILRNSVQELGQNIQRLSALRTAVLLITTVLLGVGLYEGDAGEAAPTAGEIRQLVEQNHVLTPPPIDPLSMLFQQPAEKAC